MSGIYIARMSAVRKELEASRAALVYMAKNRNKPEIIREPEFAPDKQKYHEQAASNLDVTYFVRLTAEFEGILKDHLRTNWQNVVFPARKSDWKVDWFLSKVIKLEKLAVDLALRTRLDNIRDHRNSIAHREAGVAPVTFAEALSTYNRFLSKLPDPLR